MKDQLVDQIKFSKKKLKEKSNNYVQNFKNIERYIKEKIEEIAKLKNSSKSIIPEINYSDLKNDFLEVKRNIHKRGCVIIRDVLEDDRINTLNKELEVYIESNGYYEDQKKKAVWISTLVI